jgi:hypothetical protein
MKPILPVTLKYSTRFFFLEGNDTEIYIYKARCRQLTVTLQLCYSNFQIPPVQQQVFTNTFRTARTCEILFLRVVGWNPCWASIFTTVHKKPTFESHCRSTQMLPVLFILHFSLKGLSPSYLNTAGEMVETLRRKCSFCRGGMLSFDRT